MYSPFLDGMVRGLPRRSGVDAERDDRTVRVGGRKVTGIAAHRNRPPPWCTERCWSTPTWTHCAPASPGRVTATWTGRRDPSPSRPDQVVNIAGDAIAAETAIVAAFPEALPIVHRSLDPGSPPWRRSFDEPATTIRDWHAGPWKAVMPAAVAAVLGGR